MKTVTKKKFDFYFAPDEVEVFADILQAAADDGFFTNSAKELEIDLRKGKTSFYAGELAFLWDATQQYGQDDDGQLPDAVERFMSSDTLFQALQANFQNS